MQRRGIGETQQQHADGQEPHGQGARWDTQAQPLEPQPIDSQRLRRELVGAQLDLQWPALAGQRERGESCVTEWIVRRAAGPQQLALGR